MGSSDSKRQYDMGILSSEEKLVRRIQDVCMEFDYSAQTWKNIDEFMESESECRLVLFQLADSSDKQELSKQALEMAQVISQQTSGAYLIAITNKSLPRDDMVFLRKSGLDIVANLEDFFETSKLEFIATQVLRATYVPIKESDLIPGVPIAFDLFHLMPMSNKFLRIVRSGGTVSDSKLQKMREIGEFYIFRGDLENYSRYIAKFSDSSTKEGALRACRGKFMEFYKKFTDLVGILTDPSQFISYEAGRKLLEDCNAMVKDLAESLGKIGVGDVWDVINNSVIGDFGSLERSTAIAAYVAYFGMKMRYHDIENVIFAALICDLGLIYLPPQVTKKIRHNQVDEFNAEELDYYRRYPFKSLDVILRQKLPVSPEIKDIVMKCHEKSDGSGFPSGLSSSGISKASQLLGFCWSFDQKTILRMGKKRLNREVALKEIIAEELSSLKSFTPAFLLEFKRHFG